jgi:ubiquinone/menaquinone biosynthesis C-methylase UbiE
MIVYNDEHWMKMNVDVLKLDNRRRSVLDVGCGSGARMKEFMQAGHECCGLEINKENAMNAKASTGSQIAIADACHIPFRNDYFDIVYSNEFFSHVTDIQLALTEQARVLKVGGHVLVRDSNLLCPFILFDLLVLYPIRTKGKRGGLKWLATHQRRIPNYESGTEQKDENVKTLEWWKAIVLKQRNLKLILATTSYAHRHPRTKILKHILNQIVIVAERT